MNILKLVLIIVLFGGAFNAYAVDDYDWAFCDGKLAFVDEELTEEKPISDWVCKLPVAEDHIDINRCRKLRILKCQIGAGGTHEAHSKIPHKLEEQYLPENTKFAMLAFEGGYMSCTCLK